jgi:hypothetical protein
MTLRQPRRIAVDPAKLRLAPIKLHLVTFADYCRQDGSRAASFIVEECGMVSAEICSPGSASSLVRVQESPPFDIFGGTRIAAETRRVLYALATPEYLEAWLQFPDIDRIECHPEERSYDRFRIDLFSSKEREGCIHGSCLLSMPNRVTYLWERRDVAMRFKSVAEIWLFRDDRHCTLRLRYSGLESDQDREWHLLVWRLSLERLCTILNGSDRAN